MKQRAKGFRISGTHEPVYECRMQVHDEGCLQAIVQGRLNRRPSVLRDARRGKVVLDLGLPFRHVTAIFLRI